MQNSHPTFTTCSGFVKPQQHNFAHWCSSFHSNLQYPKQKARNKNLELGLDLDLDVDYEVHSEANFFFPFRQMFLLKCHWQKRIEIFKFANKKDRVNKMLIILI